MNPETARSDRFLSVLPVVNPLKVNGLIWILALTLGTGFTFSQNPDQTFPQGSYIIDMGQDEQTYANGLKPYGLVYQLITNLEIPVTWAVNSSKVKDGEDFTADGKSYKGGPFIIPANHATQTVLNEIVTWQAKGVVVDGPLAVEFTAPVYKEITSWPRAVIDLENDKLIVPHYENAEVPVISYLTQGNPTELNHCGDVYVFPHGDPHLWVGEQAAYGPALDSFVKANGYLWIGCHAVSALETLAGINFLSKGGLVDWDNHENGTPAYTYNPTTAGDPIMQFIGTMDEATLNGSEQVFLPSAEGWRSGTTIAVSDPDHPQLPELSPGPAAVVAYGPAYDTAGMVMAQAGHTLNRAMEAENTAGQRAYFNFLLMAGVNKQLEISTVSSSNTLVPNTAYKLQSQVSGGVGPYTYEWSSSCGGIFTNTDSSSTTFITPVLTEYCRLFNLNVIIIKQKISDNCGRVNFEYTVLGMDSTTSTHEQVNTAGFSLKVRVNGRGDIFFPITKVSNMPASIKIFNARGDHIWSKSLSQGKQGVLLKLPEQHKGPRGIYYIQLTQGDKTLTRRFPLFN